MGEVKISGYSSGYFMVGSRVQKSLVRIKKVLDKGFVVVVYLGLSTKHSSVAQWQSNRLLTDRSLVRIQPGELQKILCSFSAKDFFLPANCNREQLQAVSQRHQKATDKKRTYIYYICSFISIFSA